MKFDWGHLAARSLKKRASLLNSSAVRSVNTFRHDEDGSGSLLSFYVTLMLLLMAGLGVDTMRHEMERTHLQATLDAAVLAGAGAATGTEAGEVADIVEDYFAKNDMSEFLNEIDLDGDDADIQVSLNATRVYASADMEVDTYLLQMTGVDSLTAAGEAEAQVATPKLEVALVLDVSGSMAGDKLDDLQDAANEFVTTILNGADPGDAVISVVPFAFTTTPSQELFDALSVNKTHDYSTCLRFDAADYNSASIDPTVQQDQQIFTSRYGSFNDLDEWWRSCYNDANAEILPYSISETDLHAHINALTADGNTSAHIGMKWGAALLDSDFQSVVTDLQTDGVVDASLNNLPALAGESETLKIIVLMADGVNTTSYYFDTNSSYRGDNSELYLLTWRDVIGTTFEYAWRYRRNGTIRESYNESRCSNSNWTCVYSPVYGPEKSAYYLYSSYWNEWVDAEEVGPDIGYWYGDDYWVYNSNFQNFLASDEFVSLDRLSWEEAWGLMSPDYYCAYIDCGASDDYNYSSTENGSTKDTRMQAICTASKNEGIVVYTIGYDITANGNAETQLEDCASSLNNYYPTDGEDIGSAFNSIASNVKNLRLTQ